MSVLTVIFRLIVFGIAYIYIYTHVCSVFTKHLVGSLIYATVVYQSCEMKRGGSILLTGAAELIS